MFPITMSFTVANEAQLTKLVAAAAPTLPVVEAVKNPTPKPEAAKTEKPAATPPTAEASAAPEPKAENSAPAAASAKTVDDAKALTMKIVADKGRDVAVELLKKHGVPVAAKLAADQVAAFCADAEAVLAS